jgi:hypothetical protein
MLAVHWLNLCTNSLSAEKHSFNMTAFRNIAPCSLVEVGQTSETSVRFHKTKRCNIQEGVIFILTTIRTWNLTKQSYHMPSLWSLYMQVSCPFATDTYIFVKGLLSRRVTTLRMVRTVFLMVDLVHCISTILRSIDMLFIHFNVIQHLCYESCAMNPFYVHWAVLEKSDNFQCMLTRLNYFGFDMSFEYGKHINV